VAGTLAAPGTWEDITQQQCNGALGTAPFGSIVVANGYASFSAASPGRGAFPYVWRGPPSRPSPVPENGDFELSVRLRFDEINVNGTGVAALRWNSSEPVADNSPGQSNAVIFDVWEDGATHVWLLDQDVDVTGRIDSRQFHTYTLRRSRSTYTALVDTTVVAGPIQSALRPNCIWIGNPIFGSWNVGQNWSSFTLDEIRVEPK